MPRPYFNKGPFFKIRAAEVDPYFIGLKQEPLYHILISIKACFLK